MSEHERRSPREGEAARRSGAGREDAPRQSSVRRKKRGGMGVAGALLYVVFVIGISALLAGIGWVAANDVLALNKAPHSAVITLSEDLFTYTTVEDADGNPKQVSKANLGPVLDALKENGIIEFKTVFRLYAAFSSADIKIAPGTYELSTDMDYRAIVTNMSSRSASRVTASVTIPEGYTVSQVFQLLQEKGISTVDKLSDMAATHDYNFSFLKELPLGSPSRLEGYLFPDTYQFYLGEDPKTVLNKMLLNFDRRLTEAMRQEAVAEYGSLHNVIMVASMIEKETDGTDQRKIASVIYNRLNNPGKGTNGYLQIDATIQYVLPERKAQLTAEDQAIDSLYNTYKYPGLPAGPIANPGLAALNAALNPEQTSYYYYALGDDGVHHFFKTYSEQQSFIATQEIYKNG